LARAPLKEIARRVAAKVRRAVRAAVGEHVASLSSTGDIPEDDLAVEAILASAQLRAAFASGILGDDEEKLLEAAGVLPFLAGVLRKTRAELLSAAGEWARGVGSEKPKEDALLLRPIVLVWLAKKLLEEAAEAGPLAAEDIPPVAWEDKTPHYIT